MIKAGDKVIPKLDAWLKKYEIYSKWQKEDENIKVTKEPPVFVVDAVYGSGTLFCISDVPGVPPAYYKFDELLKDMG